MFCTCVHHVCSKNSICVTPMAACASVSPLAKINVLLIDDFGIAPNGPRERNDLFELLDDRIGARVHRDEPITYHGLA